MPNTLHWQAAGRVSSKPRRAIDFSRRSPAIGLASYGARMSARKPF